MSSARSSLALKSFEFSEWLNGKLHWEYKKTDFESFNLLLGDNAQGKTTLFNVLKFFHNIHSPGGYQFQQKLDPSNFSDSKFMFCDESGSTILYDLKVSVSKDGTKRIFEEVIKKNDIELFNRSEERIINEKDGQDISNFFIPESSPAVSTFVDERFTTIGKIRSFFERMVFLDAYRGRIDASIRINAEGGLPADLFINDDGSNIQSVLYTWQSKQLNAYDDVIGHFQESFKFIKEGSVKVKEDVVVGIGLRAPILSYVEKVNEEEVQQFRWSHGMFKSLCLYALPVTPFVQDGYEELPSLICVDEIDAGLDFKTLQKVIEYYESRSNLSQILISTHAPIVCNMVDSKHWRVFKRRGVTVQTFIPDSVEPDARKDLLDNNWEFYSRHVAQSEKYEISEPQ